MSRHVIGFYEYSSSSLFGGVSKHSGETEVKEKEEEKAFRAKEKHLNSDLTSNSIFAN